MLEPVPLVRHWFPVPVKLLQMQLIQFIFWNQEEVSMSNRPTTYGMHVAKLSRYDHTVVLR